MGGLMSIYLPMNGLISKYINSSITANMTFFIVAFFTAFIIFLVFGDFTTIPKLESVPRYLFLSGFFSAFIILGTTFLIPHLGARTFFILLITGQIMIAIVVSNYGILSSPKDPITIKKILGAALVILGAFISTH
jgi:transporter family-2 protein